MSRLAGLSLATRLTLVAVLILIPVVALTVVTFSTNQAERRTAAVRNATTVGGTVAAVVNGFARDLESLTLGLAILSTGVRDPNQITQTNAGPILSTMVDEHGSLRTLFYTSPDGIVLASSAGVGNGTDLSGRDYIQALQRGEDTFWSGGFSGLETGEVVVTHSRKITNVEGDVVAFLVAAFYPEQLLARLPALPDDAGLVVIDSSGRVLFSTSDPGLDSTPAALGDVPEVQEALAGSTTSFSDHQPPFAVSKQFGAVVPVERLGWAVAYSRPQSVLDGTVQTRFWTQMLTLAAISAASIVALLLIARRMSAPLTALSDVSRRIAAGERPDVPQMSADPDVTHLAEAMTTMSRAIAARETELTEQARVLSTLESVGSRLASELDFDRAVQAVTEAGTSLTQAETGVFFYSGTSSDSEVRYIVTSSEIRPEALDLPAIRRDFFRHNVSKNGTHDAAHSGATRIDDVERLVPAVDPAVLAGLRSVIAVPVRSRTGGGVGGLIFGHTEPGHFTEAEERLAVGLAGWAGVALDNARLFHEAQVVQDQLRQANKAKDEFLGLVSHELRTPTTTIFGGLRILQLRGRRISPEDAEDLIASMAGEAARLVRLIENLLALARIELGQVIECEPNSLNPLIATVVQAFKRSTPEREVTTDFEPDLPIVMVEATYFEQVVQNLLSNANKYSPAGQPIEVITEESDGEVRIRVRDHGMGVEDNDLDRIFDSFYRADRTARGAQGMGLGLAVVRRLIDAQAGRVWAANRTDTAGLEVTIALPAVSVAGQSGPVDAGVEANA